MSGHGDSKRAVVAAMTANAGIAIAKFVAAFFSGSITMLAEGVHSVADTANQGLLLLGMGLAEKTDPERYPLGRAKERYFWAFIVALMLFFLGGVYAIYEGVHKLREPSHAPGSQIVPLVVLSVSILLEGGSFVVAFREFKKQKGDKSFGEALFEGRDPTIPVVLLEDTGAIVGLVVALASVLVTWVTGSSVADSVGSIVIGVLLCTIGVLLARDTKSLLIGESATPEMRARALELMLGTPGVEAVTKMLTMHLGPDTILVALKVRFRDGMTVAECENVIDDLEARVREGVPQMKKIFVEPDGDYSGGPTL
ncbi:MAG: cation diffusion facilitator family transporter [Polyangiaceae bacterium]